MNETLAQVASRYPQVTIVDWNGYSAGHYSWFQSDGEHLLYDGATALATELHEALEKAPAPPLLVHDSLPAAVVGHLYGARLAATGGVAPYRWRITSGPLPRGLHLLADGVLYGRPRRSTRLRLVVRVTDSFGTAASGRLGLALVGLPKRARVGRFAAQYHAPVSTFRAGWLPR